MDWLGGNVSLVDGYSLLCLAGIALGMAFSVPVVKVQTVRFAGALFLLLEKCSAIIIFGSVTTPVLTLLFSN